MGAQLSTVGEAARERWHPRRALGSPRIPGVIGELPSCWPGLAPPVRGQHGSPSFLVVEHHPGRDGLQARGWRQERPGSEDHAAHPGDRQPHPQLRLQLRRGGSHPLRLRRGHRRGRGAGGERCLGARRGRLPSPGLMVRPRRRVRVGNGMCLRPRVLPTASLQLLLRRRSPGDGRPCGRARAPLRAR
jgi:hypothetical protein